jgi:hypothetical protein
VLRPFLATLPGCFRRTLRFPCCPALALILFNGSAWGDITVASYVLDPGGFPCGSKTGITGTTEASYSFACTVQGKSFAGSASVEVGIGPFGIGAEYDLEAASPDMPPYTYSSTEFDWSQQYILRGPAESGFVQPVVDIASVCAGCDFGYGRLRISIFGRNYGFVPCVFLGPCGPIPRVC